MSEQNINTEYLTISSRFQLPVEQYYQLVLSQLEWPPFVKNIRVFDFRDLATKDSRETIGAFWGEMDFLAHEGIILYQRSREFFSWVVIDEPVYTEHCNQIGWVVDEDIHCHIINRDD